MKSPKVGAAISIGLLLVYLFLLTNWAVRMVFSGTPVGVAMGLLVFAFPLLGLYAIYRELRFGLKVEALGKKLEAAGEWPIFDLVLRPSGRPTRESADLNIETFAELAKANPESWKAQFALALAYDACADRPRARTAMSKAIKLSS